MLAFYPEFESTSDSEGHTSDFEVTFVLDLSNSMSGSALQDAKKVLLLVLRHLPSACLFNVVVFGTCNYILLVFKYSCFDFVENIRLFLKCSVMPTDHTPLTSTWPQLRCDVGLEEGGY